MDLALFFWSTGVRTGDEAVSLRTQDASASTEIPVIAGEPWKSLRTSPMGPKPVLHVDPAYL
ncbi:hypothetical protein HF690_05620 [Oleiagrimonas citrea]|uniref:Uncharacterized protein n=1 Tax=Oleiagrimonas citrea TaxID=1665687 RepID=A0A846ZJG0_9GAMM|nr:hypothetical protein [Oleiagrimonas citrea]NKZ38435.1 hypothetical protein [Oleiagrimonas citrea]